MSAFPNGHDSKRRHTFLVHLIITTRERKNRKEVSHSLFVVNTFSCHLEFFFVHFTFTLVFLFISFVIILCIRTHTHPSLLILHFYKYFLPKIWNLFMWKNQYSYFNWLQLPNNICNFCFFLVAALKLWRILHIKLLRFHNVIHWTGKSSFFDHCVLRRELFIYFYTFLSFLLIYMFPVYSYLYLFILSALYLISVFMFLSYYLNLPYMLFSGCK